MTTNAFIFVWTNAGIEQIVPISEYEKVDHENTMRILKGEEAVRSPLTSILQTATLRARYNIDRNYSIYAIDCDSDLSEAFWWDQWENHFDSTAKLIKSRGICLY